MKKYPKYVMMGTNTALQIDKYRTDEGDKDDDKPYYWRDAGGWGVYGIYIDGKLVSESHHKELDGWPLEACSKEQWKKSNKGYV